MLRQLLAVAGTLGVEGLQLFRQVVALLRQPGAVGFEVLDELGQLVAVAGALGFESLQLLRELIAFLRETGTAGLQLLQSLRELRVILGRLTVFGFDVCEALSQQGVLTAQLLSLGL